MESEKEKLVNKVNEKFEQIYNASGTGSIVIHINQKQFTEIAVTEKEKIK